MTVLEAVISFVILVAFFVALIFAIWEVGYRYRRKHRLEREAEQREHKKQLAADFAEIQKQLGEGAFSFGDYIAEEPRKGTANIRPIKKKGGTL